MCRVNSFFKYILLIVLLPLSHFFLPFVPLHPAPTHQHPLPPLSSCPWVMHKSSLASPFPILFLTSPCLFYTYQLCFLFPVPFPPFSTFLFPIDMPLDDFHIYDSVSVLLVCLVRFLDSIVDSCKFIAILTPIFFIIFLR